MKNNLPDLARKRKGLFLLFLPVLLVPVLGLVAWNSNPATASPEPESKGLNLELPSPQLEKKQSSKSDAYQALTKESKPQQDWPMPDFLNHPLVDPIPVRTGSALESGYGGKTTAYINPVGSKSNALSSEQAMMIQLKELENVLSSSQGYPSAVDQSIGRKSNRGQDAELVQLQRMMDQMQAGKSQPDPEIRQLEGLMDKILQLQYPDKYTGSHQMDIEEFDPFPLDASIGHSEEFVPDHLELTNGFFGLGKESLTPIPDSKSLRKAISASVGRTQEIIPGEALELILEEEMRVGGQVWAPGSLLYAKTTLEGSRLQVQVSGVLRDGVLIPVSLKGYGLDGIPGMELGDMKGASQWIKASGQSAQSLNIQSMGMDWQSQLANSGIQATRSLIRNKSKIRKIEIKSGHPVLLIDSSTSKTHAL